MKLIYLKLAEKSAEKFWCICWFQNFVFKISVTIQPGRSLLTGRYLELLDKTGAWFYISFTNAQNNNFYIINFGITNELRAIYIQCEMG